MTIKEGLKKQHDELMYDLIRCKNEDEQLKVANVWTKKYNRNPGKVEHVEIRGDSICLWPKWEPISIEEQKKIMQELSGFQK